MKLLKMALKNTMMILKELYGFPTKHLIFIGLLLISVGLFFLSDFLLFTFHYAKSAFLIYLRIWFLYVYSIDANFNVAISLIVNGSL